MKLLRLAVAALVVVASMTATGAAASATPSPAPRVRAESVHSRVLPSAQRGDRALRTLDDATETNVAARNHMSVAALRATVKDKTVWLSTTGRIFYVDRAEAAQTSAAPTSPTPSATWVTYPEADTFALHSDPGSSRTIYLDFDGYSLGSGAAWADPGQPGDPGYPYPTIPAGNYGGFDSDGIPATFSSAEKTYVQDVWRIVAEKYAPFDVDVTTAPTADDELNRADGADTTYGTHVVITSDMNARGNVCTATSSGGCVGIAWLSAFNETGETGSATNYLEPAWVYTKFTSATTTRTAGQTANVAAHEIGHTVGLHHDGWDSDGVYNDTNNPPNQAYYAGHDSWFPIMGSSDRAVGHFDNGASYAHEITPGQANLDDVQTMVSTGLPLRSDDDPGTQSLGAAASYAREGVIERPSDVDSFSIDRTCTDSLAVSVEGIGMGQAVDLKLTVTGPGGTPTSSSDPATSADTSTLPNTPTNMNAAVNVASPGTGTWTITVEGVGLAGSTGYPDYGSVGQYHLSISGCPVAGGNPPSAPTNFQLSPASHDTKANISWTAPMDPGDSPITGYQAHVQGGSTFSYGSSATQGTITGLTPGVTYTVDLVAMNSQGSSPAVSGTVKVATWNPTSAPTVTVAVSGTSAQVAWVSPSNPGLASATNATLRIWQGSTKLFEGSFTSGPVLLSGFVAGNYSTTVSIGYSSDEGSSTVTGSKTFAITTRASAARIGTAASGTAGGTSSALARWAPPLSTGNSPITSYKIYGYKYDSSNNVLRTYSVIRSASSRYYTWVLPTGRYRFRVRAFNKLGAGPYSSYSNVVAAR